MKITNNKVENLRVTSSHVVDQMMKHVMLERGNTILEPSAGNGDLLDHIIFGYYLCNDIDCIELNEERRKVLQSKNYNVIGTDFLKFESNKKYDWIIAAPNSINSYDVDHVMQMYKFVKPEGTIVSLMDPIWMIGERSRHKKFRKWIADKNYKIVMLEDNSFIENFKTRPTIIIVIKK